MPPYPLSCADAAEDVTLDTSKLTLQERQKFIDDVVRQGWRIAHTKTPRIHPSKPMHNFYYVVTVPRPIASEIRKKVA